MTSIQSTSSTQVQTPVDVNTLETQIPESTSQTTQPTPRIAGGGYFEMMTLAGLGLPTPGTPKDIDVYLAELLDKVEEEIAKADLQSILAANELVKSLYSMYAYIYKLEAYFEEMMQFKADEVQMYSKKLVEYKKERTELLADQKEYEEKLEKADKPSEVAKWTDKIEESKSKIKNLNSIITGVEIYIPKAEAERKEYEVGIEFLDYLSTFIHNQVIRENSNMSIDSQSSEDKIIQRFDEVFSKVQSKIAEMGVMIERLREAFEQFVETAVERKLDQEQLEMIQLIQFEKVLKEIPVQEDSGILHKLPTHQTDLGGRVLVGV